MRVDRTASFETDWERLKPEHRREFREIVRVQFIPAFDASATAQAAREHYVWIACVNTLLAGQSAEARLRK